MINFVCISLREEQSVAQTRNAPAITVLGRFISLHFSGVLLTAYGQANAVARAPAHANPHPYTRSCAALQIATAPFSTPTGACSAPWSSVVLSMRGSVRGVQFDRYGALWIGGVELLRTTVAVVMLQT